VLYVLGHVIRYKNRRGYISRINRCNKGGKESNAGIGT
jgi:hypothetical protein